MDNLAKQIRDLLLLLREIQGQNSPSIEVGNIIPFCSAIQTLNVPSFGPGSTPAIWQYSIPSGVDLLVTEIDVRGMIAGFAVGNPDLDESGFCALRWAINQKPQQQYFSYLAITGRPVFFKFSAGQVVTLQLNRDSLGTASGVPAQENIVTAITGFLISPPGRLSQLQESQVLQINTSVSNTGSGTVPGSGTAIVIG